MSFKHQVYERYLQLINEKFNALQVILNELNDSAKNETKSTAGDKHETALAMLQIEQENTRNKLKEITEQKLQLDRIDINLKSEKIIKGSLIKTNHGYLFLSIALGKITVENQQIIALSPQSPLGLKLVGAKINDEIELNNLKYVIESFE
ncbi:MAG: hypothetical protein IPL21_17550 [Saprospirales bacterium]|nr:hypothetical protein [Saprospirales bacterium]